MEIAKHSHKQRQSNVVLLYHYWNIHSSQKIPQVYIVFVKKTQQNKANPKSPKIKKKLLVVRCQWLATGEDQRKTMLMDKSNSYITWSLGKDKMSWSKVLYMMDLITCPNWCEIQTIKKSLSLAQTKWHGVKELLQIKFK